MVVKVCDVEDALEVVEAVPSINGSSKSCRYRTPRVS